MDYQSHGNHLDEEIEHARLAKLAKHGIVEIGVLEGHTSAILAKANPNVPVWGIDPLICDSMNPNLIGSIHKIRMNTAGCKNYNFLNAYSAQLNPTWKHRFDYIFIDGDHEYSAVKRDFEEWFRLLEPGGHVSIHDSAVDRGGPIHWPGPSRLAKELIEGDRRVTYCRTIYCLTVFQKMDNRG